MIVGIHQPNFIPWIPYFIKIALSDKFVVLAHCQYEKSGFTNRCKVNDKWWTNPVKNGNIDIMNKRYTDGQRVATTNLHLICGIAMTLGIDTTKIVMDFKTNKIKTARIVEICKFYGGDKYIANPQALKVYLDIKELNDNGIEFIPFEAKLRKHPFEMFAESGIERTKELFWKAVAQHKEELQSVTV